MFGGGQIALDIYETDTDIVLLTVPLLGIKPESIDISIAGNQVSLYLETEPEHHIPEDLYLRRERRFGQFRRSIQISRPIHAEQAKAELKDNVLRVILPKQG